MSKALRVLMVEDSETDAELVIRQLQRAGYEIQHQRVDSGAAMKAALARETWDVILSDFTIPKFGGMAALTLYKQWGLDLPFICVSGTIGEETAVAMMKAGAHDYVLKDNLAPLASAVERELRAAELRVEQRRALAEAALSAAILEFEGDAVISKTLDGRILNWSRGAERIYGYTREEMIGRSISILMSGERTNEFHELVERLQRGEAIEDYETTRVRKDGQTIDVSLRMALVRDAEGQATGASIVAHDITARKQVEAETHRMAELKSANLELRREIEERLRWEKEVMAISDREQRRIGQDLHDGLGAHLTGVTFLANTLQGKLEQKALPESADAERLVDLLNQAISQTRKLAWVLSPVSLQQQGLMKALEQLAANINEVYQIPCSLVCPRPVMLDDAVAAMNLYRITQESIHNAITHGHATRVSIGLREAKGAIQLSMRGNGQAFPAQPAAGAGMGLKIMANRARAIGATFDLRAGTRGGVVMKCSLPKPGAG